MSTLALILIGIVIGEIVVMAGLALVMAGDDTCD